MRKKTVMSRLLSRELSSLLFTVFLQTVVLDKPLKAVSDVVGDACGPAVAAGLLLVLGLVVYSVVYYVVVPPLLGYLVRGRDLEMYLKAKFSAILGSTVVAASSAMSAWKSRKSRAELEAEILLMRDTLAEHRSLSKRHRAAFLQLDRQHARAIDAYRALKETQRSKSEGARKRLAEAKEELLAWELHVFLVDRDLAAADEALKNEKRERLALESTLETEKRNYSSLDGQLQAEKTAHIELEQLVNNAYTEVAHAMGLRLDTGSMSSADKIERMARQFRMMRTDNDALHGTLESVLFDGCAKDAMISELENENDALAEAGNKKDEVIATLTEEKDQLLCETSDLRVEVDRVVRENGRLTRTGLDKDATIAALSEQKAQWILASHVQDAENAVLGEANARLHRENLAKDRKISELEDVEESLHETIDALSCSLASCHFGDQAKDKRIVALKENIRGLQESATKKDEVIVMLGERNDGLQNSVTNALYNSARRPRSDSIVKDARIRILQETVDALHGSLDFVYLEQKARRQAA